MKFKQQPMATHKTQQTNKQSSRTRAAFTLRDLQVSRDVSISPSLSYFSHKLETTRCLY